MNPESVLTSVIEVGIGIAGFSGIVAALSRTRSDWPEVARVYFSILLLMSISQVAFAFLPMLLATTGFAEEHMWRISSVVWLAWSGAILIVRITQFRRTGSSATPAMGATLLGFVVGFSLQTANVVYFNTAWPYLTTIVGGLLIAFSFFVQLLREIWSE